MVRAKKVLSTQTAPQSKWVAKAQPNVQQNSGVASTLLPLAAAYALLGVGEKKELERKDSFSTVAGDSSDDDHSSCGTPTHKDSSTLSTPKRSVSDFSVFHSDSETCDEVSSTSTNSTTSTPTPVDRNELLRWRSAAAPSPTRVRVCTAKAVPQHQQPEQTWASSPTSRLPPNSATSWAATQRAESITDDAEAGRCIRAILNKLTVEKFDVLCEQLVSLGLHSVSQMELLAKEVFEKGTAQRHFASMYADLCACLQESFGYYGFEKAFQGECRPLLEHSVSMDSIELPAAARACAEADGELSEAWEHAAKKRLMLGSVAFAGELIMRELISSQEHLVTLASSLLQTPPVPEKLEALAVLLRVVGPGFDVASFPQRADLDAIFKQVATLTEEKTVSARVCCLLQDVLDLRGDSWGGARKQAASMRLKAVRRQESRKQSKPVSPALNPAVPAFTPSANFMAPWGCAVPAPMWGCSGNVPVPPQGYAVAYWHPQAGCFVTAAPMVCQPDMAAPQDDSVEGLRLAANAAMHKAQADATKLKEINRLIEEHEKTLVGKQEVVAAPAPQPARRGKLVNKSLKPVAPTGVVSEETASTDSA